MVRRQLSIADRGRALAWLQDGATQLNDAKRLNVSQSVIGRLFQRIQGTGRRNNRRCSERRRSTTQRGPVPHKHDTSSTQSDCDHLRG